MRILVVKLSSLGDILHVLPCVHALKVQTGATIDWAVHPEFAALVRCFADVDSIVEIPRRHVAKGFRDAIRALRSKDYDLVVDLHGLMKSAIVTALSKAKRKIGPSYSRELSWLLYPERAGRMHRDCHAAVQAFDTLDYLKLERPKASMTAADFRLPSFLAPEGSPLIAIAPVSRWESKNWSVSNFAAFVEQAAEAFPTATFAVVGGKADVEVGDRIASAVPGRVVNFCGKTSVAESMVLLSRASLLVANDTGPVHMAAAVGTSCLVVFGPTRPDWTGPYGDGHRIVAKQVPCGPCLKKKCPLGTGECMESITPGDVLAVAREMLAKGGGR